MIKKTEQTQYNKKHLPRVMIAAAGSGSGKTTITCGLLNMFKTDGINVGSFKCGPDYIDPKFHREVIGVGADNLDSFFSDDAELINILYKTTNDCVLIEGVMGLYDGLSVESLEASSYDIAKKTQTPIVLVVNGKGMGRTINSLIKGILFDDTDRLIKGIILNQVSKSLYDQIKPLLENSLMDAGYNAKVLGYLPTVKGAELGSRHLGLLLPGEIDELNNKLELVSLQLKESVDVDSLKEIMENAKDCEVRPNKNASVVDKSLCLGVASDEAFCFYYQENMRVFEELGVSIVPFSPLHDEHLPKGIKGILFGGGYPENFLDELSNNKSMLVDIKNALDGGMPHLAECGGFMYLHSNITDIDGKLYPMVGKIKGNVKYMGRLVRFGYISIENYGKTGALSDYINGMKGHEFHYFDSDDNGNSCIAKKPSGKKEWQCIHSDDKSFVGFPHLYYRSNPVFIEKFAEAMRKYSGL